MGATAQQRPLGPTGGSSPQGTLEHAGGDSSKQKTGNAVAVQGAGKGPCFQAEVRWTGVLACHPFSHDASGLPVPSYIA